ncbi:enoyl-CoA hydratase-related protein [Dactylosporangium sp. NPDC051484]|uniref:enoyl-CoA hydratase/isomerase family protein n=1 Tax=Dactylosporangium sp. NPDC051484 TaxID=3154942 RepID=UPI00344FC274
MDADFDTLRVSTPRPGVALVRLHRPERLNAMNAVMFDELHRLSVAAETDPATRALVITGEGRGFSAGMDLADAVGLSDLTPARFLTRQEGWARAITGFAQLSVPVIAAVNGPAAGAGFSLALAADLRIASPAARLNAAFIRIGLTGGDCGSSWLLPRIVGHGHASEILLTGRLVDAEEAVRIGLVNRVVPAEELVDRALDIASEIVANSPLGVRLTKQVLRINSTEPSLDAAVELENRNQALTSQSADMAEAVRAFIEKRTPVFRDC